MGKKKVNNSRSKQNMVKVLESAFLKQETYRFSNTEEGRRLIEEQNRNRKNEEMKALFLIDQLVWKDDIVDDPSLETSGLVASRCNKIIVIHDDYVECEMLYALIKGVKVTEYVNSSAEDVFRKGDHFIYLFDKLEKHIAKASKNIWWKVK